MKFLIKHGWLILLVGILSACGTPTPVSPVEVAMTSMAAQAQACATLQAIGTPEPCNPPTPTPQPTATSTPQPTPTATPFSHTGWVYYPPEGGMTPMPYGWEPLECDNKVVGCPGKEYRYFVNGVPQGPDPNTYKGTPSYWPWLLVGIPVALAFFLIIGIGVYGATAPQRAMAESIKITAKVQAKLLELSGLKQPALSGPKEVSAQIVWNYIQRFIQECRPDQRFEPAMRHHMRDYRRKDELVPLETLAGWIHQFDQTNETNALEAFTVFAEKVEINQLEKRS